MILISQVSLISLVLTGLSVVFVHSPARWDSQAVGPNSGPRALLSILRESNPFEEPPLNPENIPCRQEPIGLGIPGFQPGIHQDLVFRMFGFPSQTLPGYWPNTHAVSYDLIPHEVSLGFLFDRQSLLLQQTEASFAQTVNTDIILGTLNSMLGCQLNEEITSGFEQVWQGQVRRYRFALGHLKGAIEWEIRSTSSGTPQAERVYIGIWQAGLHR
jgi:serine/threonine-protein kinase